jgi:hypothetical protein
MTQGHSTTSSERFRFRLRLQNDVQCRRRLLYGAQLLVGLPGTNPRRSANEIYGANQYTYYVGLNTVTNCGDEFFIIHSFAITLMSLTAMPISLKPSNTLSIQHHNKQQ